MKVSLFIILGHAQSICTQGTVYNTTCEVTDTLGPFIFRTKLTKLMLDRFLKKGVITEVHEHMKWANSYQMVV